MQSPLFARARRALITLALAAVLALTAAHAPLLLDGLTGSNLTATAAACSHSGGGCG